MKKKKSPELLATTGRTVTSVLQHPLPQTHTYIHTCGHTPTRREQLVGTNTQHLLSNLIKLSAEPRLE